MAPTIKERVVQITCKECRKLAEGVKRHKDLDSLLAKHAKHLGKRQRDSDEEEETEKACEETPGGGHYNLRRKVNYELKDAETPKGKMTAGLTKTAKKVLFCPPCEADEEAHMWQNIFVDILEDGAPNDKLSLNQDVKIDSRVSDRAYQFGRAAAAGYLRASKHCEENNMPIVYGLAAGLIACIGGQETALETGPVRYFVKEMIDGEEVLVSSSPPGESRSEATDKTIEHDDLRPRKWKTDVTMYSRVEVDGRKIWVLRVLVEAKGDAGNFLDLYQASLAALKSQLKRMQNQEYIERIYIEVWGTHSFYYGILDVFGYITVKNGIVTKKSYDSYQASLNKRKDVKNFPVASLVRCPQTLKDFQVRYDLKAKTFLAKYHCQLPSSYGLEDFPVGIAYFYEEPRVMPLGVHAKYLSKEEENIFVQGHLRILASNSIVEGDDCNEKLIQNFEDFMENIKNNGADAMFSEPPPPPEIYKIVKDATEHTMRVGDYLVERVPKTKTASSSAITVTGTAKASATASKQEVAAWTCHDVAKFLHEVCRARFSSVALKESAPDGKLLTIMSEKDVNEWLSGLNVHVMDRMRVLLWFRELD